MKNSDIFYSVTIPSTDKLNQKRDENEQRKIEYEKSESETAS